MKMDKFKRLITLILISGLLIAILTFFVGISIGYNTAEKEVMEYCDEKYRTEYNCYRISQDEGRIHPFFKNTSKFIWDKQ